VAGCAFPPDQSTLSSAQSPFLTCDPTGFCDPGFTVDAAVQGIVMLGFGFDDVPRGQAGPWSQGAYFDSPTVLTSALGGGMWVSFLPAEQPEVSSATAPTAPPSPSPAAPPAPVAPATIGLPNTGRDAAATPPAALGVAALALLARRRRTRPRRAG
jgi:LPXTG-motif cell wall-anchored protein